MKYIDSTGFTLSRIPPNKYPRAAGEKDNKINHGVKRQTGSCYASSSTLSFRLLVALHCRAAMYCCPVKLNPTQCASLSTISKGKINTKSSGFLLKCEELWIPLFSYSLVAENGHEFVIGNKDTKKIK